MGIVRRGGKCGQCGTRAICYDHIDRDAYQLRGERRKRIRDPFRQTELERDRLPLDITEITNSFAKGSQRPSGLVGSGRQDTDPRHFGRLLRACRERQRSRSATTHKRDEFPPPHGLRRVQGITWLRVVHHSNLAASVSVGSTSVIPTTSARGLLTTQDPP